MCIVRERRPAGFLDMKCQTCFSYDPHVERLKLKFQSIIVKWFSLNLLACYMYTEFVYVGHCAVKSHHLQILYTIFHIHSLSVLWQTSIFRYMHSLSLGRILPSL